MFERLDEKLKAALAAVQKPGRYTGGEPGSIYKEKDKVDVRFAFCFPDTYEVGMSFLGMKILYEILNKRDNIWCERVFMPWVDMKEQMQQRDIPLYALESKDPLGMFDVVGLTLLYELSYTNILAMLDLAHIPFYAKDRGEDAPFIVAGGPCVCNAEPLADFFDLMMLGEGEAEYQGTVMPGKRAMELAGIAPVELAAKEGLALINGTQIMTAIACGVVYDAVQLAKTADIAAAITCQALHGIRKAFDPKVHALRGQPGQITAAENLRRLLEGSGLSSDLNPDKVQDAYAIRCTPQIHGASRDAIGYVWGVASREINAVTDNPLIFPAEDEAISGGNFHGQPVALAMDFLGIALAEYANVSERRLENPALSEGLPAFLTRHGGVHSGFMIAQYAAASMVSESKIYAHPASVDSIPSSANQEDHVSMGTTAARKALMILDNSQKVLGIELFAGAQALWLRGEDGLSPATRAVYDRIRQAIPPVDQDVVMHPLMVQADELVKAHAISQAAEAVCGELQ